MVIGMPRTKFEEDSKPGIVTVELDDNGIHESVDCGRVPGLVLLPRAKLETKTNDFRQKTVVCTKAEAEVILDRHLHYLDQEKQRILYDVTRLRTMKAQL